MKFNQKENTSEILLYFTFLPHLFIVPVAQLVQQWQSKLKVLRSHPEAG